MPDPRLELEARLRCPKCGGTPYLLYRRQVAPESPVYENVLWPAPGTTVPPPTRTERIVCPDCPGVQCVRGAA